MALPAEQHAAYAVIIDRILAKSDLNTISAKRIRKELQDEVGEDLTAQKSAITDLIMERFDKAQQKLETSNGVAEPAPTANGTAKVEASNGGADTSTSPPPSAKRKAESDEPSELDVASPAPKKAKKNKTGETDAQLAARLQAELNAVTGRLTRGGGAKRKQPIKKEKKTKKKSSAKVNSDDDSEVESGEPKPEREKKGGFHKPMNLSAPLSELLGETQLSRPQTVKKIWEYVKERDLQNPKDKRQIMCDEKMQAVFKGESVHMFTMNKLLANHLYPVDEVS
ncbi:uncharacterized protein MYCFIDRAFT_56639 [Pseudocercospora fijiensis CIRAD86]|uniref:Uncharacterized protein n=1 Tax=Pseudocercospora fijiensis (strain CIRAD86) TaxID=383855 RepID=M2YR23_PSEFD|nr:uncharacterized protein MYCFIDRAFT_56639 [Pseudocercospora fijiensis CIRAD86]EME80160.1 hypothetical protein MYCFIDRAFT_56639 [Pseudocercospora fijiensis CIRAD86]